MAAYTDVMNTGLSWLPQIPRHWKLEKVDALFSERKNKVSDKDYAPLSVTKCGILPQLEHAAKSSDGDNRKLVKAGDFVINSRSDRKGSCGISPVDGSVSLINIVLTPRVNLNKEYIHFLLRNYRFSEEFYRNGRGIVADLWTTRYSEMRTILLPVPPREEQDQIVRFLDWKTSEINRLIEIKKNSIEGLKQLKRCIVEKAVTRGIKDCTNLVDTGNPWISEIPSGWEIQRLKSVAVSIEKGSGISRDDVVKNGNIQCVRYGEIYSQYEGCFSSTSSRTDLEKVHSPRHVSYGEILFAGTGELIQEIGKNIVYLGKDDCLAGGDIIVLKHSQNPLFLNYALNSIYVQNQKSFGKFKLKVVHIKPREIGNLWVALPPLCEQETIASYLDSTCTKINHAINLAVKQIDCLVQLKNAIISNAVVGGIDVRGISIPEYVHVDDALFLESDDIEKNDITELES